MSMSTFATTLQSPRFQRRLLAVAAIVLVAGIVAFVSVRLGSHGDAKPVARSANAPVKDVSKVPKATNLNPQATRVAQEFILTAVARKNLRKAYTLSGPHIRQGQSLKEWMTGNIAVVPYPVAQLDIAPMKVDYSYPTEAGIEVALLPKKGAKVRPLIFYMDLVKTKGKWVVDGWVPRASPKVPLAPN